MLTEMSGDRPTVVIVKANGGAPAAMGSPDLDPRVDSLSRRRRRRSRLQPVGAACGLPRARAGHGARGGRLRRRRRLFVNDRRRWCDATSDPSTYRPSGAARSSRRPTARASASCRRRGTATRAARAHVAVAAEGDGGDRGHAILDARRRARPARDHARGGRSVRAGRIVEGGSTIPQQLARDRYLRAPAPTLSRKLQEACLATQLEQRHSRRAILQDYLDGAYYGHHAYGVQAAAETYFCAAGRPPDDGAGGAARRAPAGTHRVRPARASRRGSPAPARGARRAAGFGGDRTGAAGRPTAAAASAARRALRRRWAATLFEYARRELIERLAAGTRCTEG